MKHTSMIFHRATGFTLLEMAVVLMIVGLLLGGLLVPLSAQMDQRNNSDTQKILSEIKEALIGYAIVNGRLPCPASSTSFGAESPLGGGNCTNFYDGFVPAATLGLSGTTDSTGVLIDSWGNPIHYAVTAWSSTTPAVTNVFTTVGGMSTIGISNLSPNLLVCSTATGISGSSCGTSSSLTATPGVPVVIFSTGKNGAQGIMGIDESSNLDGNAIFVSHTSTPSGAPNGYFDDIIIWISPNVLINRMVAAGKLP